MIRTKVVDRANQIHPVLQRLPPTRQCPAAACQRCQALAEGRVEPLDVGGVDDAVPLRAASERLDACRRALYDAPLDIDDTPLGIAFHDLCDAEVAPGAQTGAPRGAP